MQKIFEPYTYEDWEKALRLAEKLYSISNKWSTNTKIKLLAYYINVAMAERSGLKINMEIVKAQLQDFDDAFQSNPE